ncbi:hypothetical protein N9940_01135 [bacterium]|nr:hypothetical protein [bacterium]
MNREILEQRLRQPLEKAQPRPGFETRLQAMVHHELKPTRQLKRSRLWLAVPAFVALFLLLLIADPEKRTTAPVAQVPPEPVEEKVTLVVSENSALHQEARGFEKDAKRTADFLFKAMPSISISKQKPE